VPAGAGGDVVVAAGGAAAVGAAAAGARRYCGASRIRSSYSYRCALSVPSQGMFDLGGEGSALVTDEPRT
jgi:hypothetical protein